MANQVATQNNQGTALGRVSDKFANLPMKDELGAGIQSSFGLIGYRGKVWSIKYRGDEEALMREDGDGPANSLEVVIVQSSENISKTFYVDGYVEGSNAAPDCYSNNGLTPEPNSPKLQNPVCATCPHNIWGSKVTPAGKQGKACADNKRLAVVPQADISNEVYGGPMLLRVPAASLQDLAQYGAKMHQLGYPYFGIATRISFDVNQAYPKFLFKGIRTLTDEEAELVLTMRNSTAVNRVLSENIDGGTPSVQTKTPANPLEEAFEQPPQDQSNGAASSTPAQSAGVNGNTTQQASANILVPLYLKPF